MKKIVFVFLAFFYAAAVWAQDAESETETDMPVENAAWYASPWVWVLFAAILLLLLVSLTKKSNRN